MDKMQEQYEKAVDVLQIQGLLGKSIFDLSSGEKQKVAIASIYMVGVGIMSWTNHRPIWIRRVRSSFVKY